MEDPTVAHGDVNSVYAGVEQADCARPPASARASEGAPLGMPFGPGQLPEQEPRRGVSEDDCNLRRDSSKEGEMRGLPKQFELACVRADHIGSLSPGLSGGGDADNADAVSCAISRMISGGGILMSEPSITTNSSRRSLGWW